MGLPPRQPAQTVAAGRGQKRRGATPTFEGLNFEEIAQQALDVSRAAAPYVPVVGPALDMRQDLRDGDYAGALFNGVMLAADLTPFGHARKVMRVVDAINKSRRGPLLAGAKTQAARIRNIENLKGKDVEIHHTIPMKGIRGLIPGASRYAEGLARNHPANLKIMRKADHRRMTGKWTDPITGQVLPEFNAAQKAWHGTNALQKTTALAAGATAVDAVENSSRSSGGLKDPKRRR